MIIVRITGGLGNQMFQYAFSKKLENELKKSAKYDLRFYSQQSGVSIDKRFITLESAFKIVLHPATTLELNTIVPNPLFGKIKKKVKQFLLGKRLIYIKENAVANQITIPSFEVLYMDGNWQSLEYLRNLDLYKIFNFKSIKKPVNDFLRKFRDMKLVSVHVRRGDYLNLALYKKVNNQYYLEAISELNKPNTYFLIFGDDPVFLESWNLLKKIDHTVVSGKGFKDYEEMYLMTQCQHNIITNSTFSWWGAILNKQADKIIICPKSWYTDPKLEKNLSDLIPEKWVEI